ncbi:MAG: class I SAM-dependent methyltransferase [Fimbriimonadales bacterium]
MLRIDFPFVTRRLILNNIIDRERALSLASLLLKNGFLTDVVLAEEVADDALDSLGVYPKSLGRGYGYSLAELVGVHACTTEHLLHVSSDTSLQGTTWIEKAITLLRKNEQVKVVNPIWNDQIREARHESLYEDDDFYYGYGFSDQCYLITAADFKAPIYGESLRGPSRYPDYGGESFEKRVDAWMRNNCYLRATYKHDSYFHPSFRTLDNLARESFWKYQSDISLEPLESIGGIDGWLLEDEARLLSFAVDRAISGSPHGNLVEVGSYCGKSTVCIAKTLDLLGASATLHTIDPHEGELHCGIREQIDSLTALKSNLSRSRVADRVVIHEAKSTGLAWREPISFLFIDGLHDYESVQADFEHFEPYLCNHAFVAFHDYADGVGVKQFVDDLLSRSTVYRPYALTKSLIMIKTQLTSPRD